MKNYIVYICIATTIFYSCETPTKNYSLQQLGDFSFRRNYFGADSLSGKELEKFMNRKPAVDLLDISKEDTLYHYLVTEKIITDQCWDLAKFDTLPNNFTYTLEGKEIEVSVRFKHIEKDDTNNYIITFKDAKNTIAQDTLTFEFPPDVIFSKMDANTNGTDELYTLYKNYAINGDNFELNIYELKEN